MFAPNSGSYSFHSPTTPQSERESSTTITISEPSYASSNGGSSQSGSGTTSTSTLGTSITITPTFGTSITITPTSATTITITPSSGATTVTIAPTSGTTSTSRPGHTPSPSPFSVPSQASQPLQTSTSIFNRTNRFDQTQPGNRGGFGHSLFDLCQNNSRLLFGTGCPATNPFGTLPERPPQLSFGCDTSSPSVQDGISGSFTATVDLRESIKNQTDVALGITRQLLLTEGKNKNMVYSPLSIHVVLSLIVAGSTKGHTQDEMLTFLKSKSTDQLNDLASNLLPLVFADGSPSGGPCLSYANGVWVEKSLPVKASFKQVLDNAYRAVLKQVDFKAKYEEARCKVNFWALKETRGHIKDLLLPGTVGSYTRIILANALYFKGAWNQNFNESRTNMFDFYLLNGRSVKAPFMTSWKRQFVRALDGFKVLKLPYKQGRDHIRRYSMYVFLPNARDGLPALVERACSESGFLDRYLPSETVAVDKFLIPKFKISSDFEVCEVLQALGLMKRPCLSEMVVGDDPVVSLIVHKAFIEVNEEGTEAAAASAGVIKLRGLPRTVDFVADHPFLFLIKEEMTGTVLFIGHVLNPLADS